MAIHHRGHLEEWRPPRIAEQRRNIREVPEDTSEQLMRERLQATDGFIDPARRYGDLVISAFFSGDNDRKRKAALEALSDDLVNQRNQFDVARHQRMEAALADLRGGSHPLHPLRWEIEFPEVFDRQNPGFDAFVGNPPFAGKNTLAAGHAAGYPDWLKTIHEESHGNADLVAHFFRRAFSLIRSRGAFGLIATNTIGQGDTRSTGLRWICKHGGTIYEATQRKKWPGQAAVIVSVVHVHKGPLPGPFLLDGREVSIITAYLFHAGGHDDPEKLGANSGKSFQGSIVLGMGFTFDDTDTRGVTSPLVEMQRLIARAPRNAERIFPYIGGEEVNDSPTHAHHRYVINFGDMSEEEARRWPDLMSIVEEKVKPQPMRDNRETYRKYWWQFAEKRQDYYQATEGLESVLGVARVSDMFAFTYLPARSVLNDKIVLFPSRGYR